MACPCACAGAFFRLLRRAVILPDGGCALSGLQATIRRPAQAQRRRAIAAARAAICSPGKRQHDRGALQERQIFIAPDGGCALSGLQATIRRPAQAQRRRAIAAARAAICSPGKRQHDRGALQERQIFTALAAAPAPAGGQSPDGGHRLSVAEPSTVAAPRPPADSLHYAPR